MAKEAIRLQDGEVINITAAADLTGGEIIAFGDRSGVVMNDAKTGELVGLQLEGVYQVNTKTADTVALGDTLYWDDGNGEATTDANSGANKRLGYACTEKAASVAATVNVKLV